MSRKTQLISSTLGVMALLLMATSSKAQLQMKPTPTPTPLSVPTGGPGSIPGGARVISGTQKVKKVTANSRIPIELTNLSQPTGTPPKILGTQGGVFYNLDPQSGAASNIHTPTVGGVSMHQFIGIADVNGTVHGLTIAYAPQPYPYQSRLFTINVAGNTLSPGSTLKMGGNPWICGKEGDLAYDKAAGKMYATCVDAGVWKLVTINLGSGDVSVVGNMPAGGSFTGLAFSPAGEFYALDSYGRKLWKLNKTNLSSSTMIPLVPYPGQQLSNTSQSGGLGFDATGGLFASFGSDLMTIDPATGVTFVFANGNGANSGLIVTGGAGPVTHE